MTAPRLEQRLLWAAIMAALVSFIDGSVVNVALPAISHALGGGVSTQQWVIDGYLLTVSALILTAGAISDTYGRLRILRIAIAGFVVASAACALSPTATALIVARIIQGIAGALLIPSSLSLIISTFSGRRQAEAIGQWTAWTGVSFLIGPLLGGVLVDSLGWRWIFVISALPAIAGLVLLGKQRDLLTGKRATVDLLGSALAAIGLGGVTAALIEAHSGLHSPRVLLPLLAGVSGLIGFAIYNQRSRRPLVPIELFRFRNFWAGNLATFFIYGGLGLASIVPTLCLQEVLHLKASVAALVTLPSVIISILLSRRFGALAGTYGPRRFMTVGPLVASAGFGIMQLTGDHQPNIALIISGVGLFGLGLAITVAPLTSSVLAAVPSHQSGIGSAINNAVARVAGLITTACLGLIIGNRLTFIGFHHATLIIAILLAIGGLVSARWISDASLS